MFTRFDSGEGSAREGASKAVKRTMKKSYFKLSFRTSDGGHEYYDHVGGPLTNNEAQKLKKGIKRRGHHCRLIRDSEGYYDVYQGTGEYF